MKHTCAHSKHSEIPSSFKTLVRIIKPDVMIHSRHVLQHVTIKGPINWSLVNPTVSAGNWPHRRKVPSQGDQADSIIEQTEVFWRDGPYSLSLNEVCRRIETSTGSSVVRTDDGCCAGTLSGTHDCPSNPDVSIGTNIHRLLDEFVVSLTMPRGAPGFCLRKCV